MVALVVVGYSRLVDYVGRCQMVFILMGAFAGLFVVSWAVWRYVPEEITHTRPVVYALYLTADLFSTVMVTVFWTYVNDVSRVGEADRLYGPIGLGGILGGIAGSVAADLLSRPLGPLNLLLICTGLMGLCMLTVYVSDRQLGRTGEVCTQGTGTGVGGVAEAMEGARLVWRNSYLLLIVVVLASYEIVSTMNDFVLNEVLDQAYDDPSTISQVYGRLGWVINGTALLVQIFVVPALLPHKMLALLFMPSLLLITAGGFLAAPTVAMAFPLLASDNGLNYSIQQSAKETLYVPLSAVEKYKSKAFIDMFVFRAAKSLAAGAFIVATFILGDSLRLPMLMNLLVLAGWLVAVVNLGRTYETRYAPAAAPAAAS